jgi:large subunit ribosomal protein L1
MARRGKKFSEALARVERRPYSLEEAVSLVKQVAFAKFDETVEVAMRLGVNPKHADQMVRGTVVLPHGTGKTLRVAVVTEGPAQKSAEEAGAISY